MKKEKDEKEAAEKKIRDKVAAEMIPISISIFNPIAQSAEEEVVTINENQLSL